MKRSYVTAAGILVLCLASILLAGCLGSGIETPEGNTTPKETQVAGATYSFDATNDGEAYYVGLNATIKLRLPENPSMGYGWEFNTTPGLVITSDEYTPNQTGGQVVGAGGYHTWYMTATAEGIQTVSSIYKRPWEPTFGNETTFALHLWVVSGEAVPYRLLTMDANGSTVQVEPNQTFRILLPENPSTGYQWQLSIPSGLRLLDQGFVEPADPMPGAGGFHYWDITANGSGEQTISGVYKRPWEPTYGNETRFDLTARIGSSPASPNGMPARFSVFTAEDDGKTVEVPLEDEFNLRLPENPSTGYAWNLTLTSGLAIVADEYIPPATSAPMLGAGGVHSWHIRAIGEGEQKVAAVYKQPFDPTSVEDTFSMNITVT